MKKISAQEASDKILKIAKNVAEIQACGQQLTKQQQKRVTEVVAKIIANTDVNEKVLKKISEISD